MTAPMQLKFPGKWRFTLPKEIKPIERGAVNDFYDLIAKVGAQTDIWDNLELFKGEFAAVIGEVHVRSSSESWAMTDLIDYMNRAAENPPPFFQALYAGFQYSQINLHLEVPDDSIINEICQRNNIPFALNAGVLKLTPDLAPAVPIPPPPPSLREDSAQLLQESVSRSEQLLAEGRGREAVQEMLWVLESLATGFRGTPLPTGEVKGKYFNQIVRELKQDKSSNTLQRALEWCEQLHGYLSSPTGGSIRHGIDLAAGTPITTEEARFFCNLIRSYVGYLQSVHNRINGGAV